MSIQLIIILLYLLATIGIGVYAKKKSVSSDAFHGAG